MLLNIHTRILRVDTIRRAYRAELDALAATSPALAALLAASDILATCVGLDRPQRDESPTSLAEPMGRDGFHAEAS